MRAIVFAGPSLSRDEVEAIPGVEWRPPVSQGDVYRGAQTAPDVIAIIDGYFDGVPSVWHKEILWAMSRGVHVLGAGSMGALRAAELSHFGMRGLGEIFESFRDGILEDDDEVAVLHGPAELGYPSLSLAMVNARKSIAMAAEAAIIDRPVADSLISLVKSIFYQERQWKRVFALAREQGVDAAALAAFESWLEHNEQDLKQQDARRLLSHLAEMMTSPIETFRCDYEFAWTVLWDGVVSGHSGNPPSEGDATRADLDSLVLDELRLDPKLYRQLKLRTQFKQLALREAGRTRLRVDEAQRRQQLRKVRDSHGLFTRTQLERWMEQNGWTPGALDKALEHQQQLLAMVENLGGFDRQLLLEELRLDGRYIELKSRVEAKRNLDLSAYTGVDIKPLQLLAWYFESQLGESIPDNLDDFLFESGFRDRAEFYRLLKRQYLAALAIDAKKQ
ncbi:MAG: TfuA-like protein [Acidiferrobacterales bacterium]|nr:TfuA-like protein [Acidiferrobacterales bacterium]